MSRTRKQPYPIGSTKTNWMECRNHGTCECVRGNWFKRRRAARIAEEKVEEAITA